MVDRGVDGESAQLGSQMQASSADPLVTTVIPVFNRSATIGRALKSALAQDYPAVEVVVVDDGSTDDTGAVVRAIGDPRVRLVCHDSNRGAAAARNTGIMAANGAYVALLDSDDEWLQGKLRRHLAFMAKSGSAFSTTSYLLRREQADGQSSERLCRPKDCRSIERLVWSCDLSIGSTLLADTESLRKLLFDTRYQRFEDWDWLFDCVGRHEIRVLRQPLSRVYVNDWPRASAVRVSARRLLERRGGQVRASGWSSYQKFVACLISERAAAEFRAGHRPAAALLILASLARWPFRNWAFYRRLATLALGIQSDRNSAPRKNRPVMHVITGLGTGGAETTLRRVLEADPRSRDRVVVVSLTHGGHNASQLRASGIEVVEIGMRRRRFSLRGVLRLAGLIRRAKPRAIQTWMYHADLVGLLALYLSGRRRHTPIFWGSRCSDMNMAAYHWSLRLVVKLCAALSRLPDGVVANSFAGADVHRALGYRPRQMTVVANGVDTASFAAPPTARAEVRKSLGIADDAIVATCVARVDPMKDYPLFLEALRLVPHVTGIAVGDGTEALPAQEKLLRLGRRSDVPLLLAAADIFVLPSSFGEGFSNAILEAMAAGLPVIATRVGDAERIVGEAGIIVPPRGLDELVASLRRLAADPALRRALGEQARRRAQQEFSIGRCARAFALLHDRKIPEDRAA